MVPLFCASQVRCSSRVRLLHTIEHAHKHSNTHTHTHTHTHKHTHYTTLHTEAAGYEAEAAAATPSAASLEVQRREVGKGRSLLIKALLVGYRARVLTRVADELQPGEVLRAAGLALQVGVQVGVV